MEDILSKEEVRKKFKSDFERGLKQGEAEERLETFGKNILNHEKKQNILIKFLKQFNDFMIIILIIASIICASLFSTGSVSTVKLDSSIFKLNPSIILQSAGT